MKFWRTDEVAALQAGGSLHSVAATIGRSPCAVQVKARRLGITTPQAQHPCYWPPATKRRALRLRQRKLSLSEISRCTGVPFGTLRHWVYGRAARG